MATLLKGNMVFLHIPKTGGSWVKKFLEGQGLVVSPAGHEHSTYDFYAGRITGARRKTFTGKLRRSLRKRIGKEPEVFPVPVFFCVVRNPMSWYESWYKFQMWRKLEQWGAVGVPQRWHVMAKLNGLISEDFNEFMSNVNRETPGFVTSLYSMYAMNSDATVLRIENIREELGDFLAKHGHDVEAKSLREHPRENVSPQIKIEWDETIRKLTIENETAAFRLYGYDAL
jgi:hypothetical protein